MSKNDKQTKKEEIKALDSVVGRYRLPKEICPNSSEHTDDCDGIPGEVMFLHDAIFLCRRLASMQMGYSSEDHMGWTFADAKLFYEEHRFAETVAFSSLLQEESKKSIANWYFKGRSQTYLRFLAYRWDNGLVFDNYQGRIEKCIDKRKLAELDNIKDLVTSFMDKEKQVATLNGNIKNMKVGDKITDPQLLQILQGIDISVVDLMKNESD